MKSAEEIKEFLERMRKEEQDRQTAIMQMELLTVKDLRRILKVSRRTIERLVKRGLFPPPLKLGAASRWRLADISSERRRGGQPTHEGLRETQVDQDPTS
jgi:predicted DNA-binding transcriptional regulator AlpA